MSDPMNTTPIHAETITPPRTRWAAVIWGVLFAAVATSALWLLTDDDRRSGVADWVAALTPVTIVTLLILAVGVLLLVAGAAGLLRRLQRRTSPVSARQPEPDLLPE